MKKYFSFLSLLLFLSFTVEAQWSEKLSSGFTSLTLKLSGVYPDSLPIYQAQYSTALSYYSPFRFDKVNDSTYIMEKYILGNSIFSFLIDNQQVNAILKPDNHDILYIHYKEAGDYSLEYEGFYKDVFDNSFKISEIMRKIFSREYALPEDLEIDHPFQTATEYKEHVLSKIAYLQELYNQSIKSGEVKSLMNYYIRTFFVYELLKEYPTRISFHNKSLGLDSLAIENNIPDRNSSYYDRIFSLDDWEPSELLFPLPYELFSYALKDSLLNIPPIKEVGAIAYKDRLRTIFGNSFPKKKHVFYEMMLATAYRDQIFEGIPLSSAQRYEIISSIEYKGVIDYLLYTSDLLELQTKTSQENQHYFPFSKNKESVLEGIIEKYKGKVVVFDFWATWCGPCIEAFEYASEVKAKYANNEEVVFLYVTDESSEYSQWRDYTALLGGEHYYLYKSQALHLFEETGIEYLPSYILFNKEGEVEERSLGKYMGNETLIDWIEKALKE